MENRLVPRSEWRAFMNTGTKAAPVWSLMGEGFTDLEKTLSPTAYGRRYVSENTERRDVLGYSPSLSYTCDVYSKDPVVERIDRVTDRELIGADAQVDIVLANLYAPGETAGGCAAFLRTWAIMPDSKGAGTESLALSGKFAACGDAVPGEFDPETRTFVMA